MVISLQIAACHTLQHPFILELLKKLIEGSYPMLEVSVQVSVLVYVLYPYEHTLQLNVEISQLLL